MDLIWTHRASRDLVRLHDFLALKDRDAAANVIQPLTAAPEVFRTYPRMGQRLDDEAGEIRRLLVLPYEFQYRLEDQRILILNVWHSSENR